MTRRSIVALCLLLACLTVSAAQVVADEDEPPKRPDIIVVMVDDLGAIDERVLKRLPEIRSLWLQGGLRFDAAYSETPLCCPGRASFLTGQHTRRHGVVSNDARLLVPSHTIATALDDAGYFTFMAGKYLNGADRLTDHTPPGWDRVAMLGKWKGNLSSDWWIDGVPLTAGHKDRFVADKSLELLRAAPADEPIFAWLTPHAPHEADATSDEWIPDVEPRYAGDPRCSGITPWKPPSYNFRERPAGFPLDDICRSLLTVDDMVGDLRDEARNQGRDPVWVFMSDNGMAWGAGGYVMKNVPQAGRLPLYIAGPGIDGGSTKALISNIDIAPTLAALARTDMRRANGKSFVDVLRGERGGRNAMLEDHPVGGETGHGPSGPWWGVRTRDWHLVEWNGTHLYNLDEDPWEMHDVIDEHLDEAIRLADGRNRPLSILNPTPSPTPVAPTPSTPLAPSPSPTQSPSLAPTGSPSVAPATPSISPSAGPSSAPTASADPSDALPPETPVVVDSPTPRETEPASQDAIPIGGPGEPNAGLVVFLGLSLMALIGVALLVLRPRIRPNSGK